MSVNKSTASSSSKTGPTPWSLGGDAPEPQKAVTPKPLTDAERKTRNPSATHTGTDPLGRAVGPAEDHREIKAVMDLDGKIVKPDAKTGETPAQRRARLAAKEA